MIDLKALARAGFRYPGSLPKPELHDQKYLLRLPDQRMAWFAASKRGLEQLVIERRVLRLLEERCSFAAPRVIFESHDGLFDVRTMVPGSADPQIAHRLVRENAECALAFGTAIGSMLAEQHQRIKISDVSPWLPRRPPWPMPRDWINDRIHRVVSDTCLIARVGSVLEEYEKVSVDEFDNALVHTDVGFHNLAIDVELHTVNGMFDYEGAAWSDRHHDFRYLVFDRYDVFEAASAAYEAATGCLIRKDRVLLYNAACAISFLAFREGQKAEDYWCGRTLEDDLKWSRQAIERVLGI